MKINIFEKRKPVTPIKEEEKGPEDVSGRSNYIPKRPKPAAVECTHITTGGPRQPATGNTSDNFKTPIICKYNCRL